MPRCPIGSTRERFNWFHSRFLSDFLFRVEQVRHEGGAWKVHTLVACVQQGPFYHERWTQVVLPKEPTEDAGLTSFTAIASVKLCRRRYYTWQIILIRLFTLSLVYPSDPRPEADEDVDNSNLENVPKPLLSNPYSLPQTANLTPKVTPVVKTTSLQLFQVDHLAVFGKGKDFRIQVNSDVLARLPLSFQVKLFSMFCLLLVITL